MINDMYYELTTKSTIADVLLDYAQTVPESKWIWHTEQNLIFVGEEIIRRDPVLNSFIDKYDPGNRMLILRLLPNTSYSWHRDINRCASINMLLTGRDSLTMFGFEGDNPRQLINLCRVPYPPATYTLLNVSQRHAVYNFENVRYMLSISVPKPHEYADVRNYLMENNY